MLRKLRQYFLPMGNWAWLYFASFILYFFSRRYLIIHRSVMGDDLITSKVMELSWSKFFHHLAIDDNQQVLYYFIQKILWPIVPANDYGLRLLPIFFGALTLGLLLHYWWKQTESMITSFLFSLLFILSPNIINISIFARPYSLLFLLVCWNLFSLRKVFQEQRLGYDFFISLSLIFLTHHLGALYILSLLLFLGVNHFSFIKKHFLGFLLTLIPFGGFFLYKFNQGIQLIDWNNREGFEVADKYFSFLFVPFKSYFLLILFLLILMIPLIDLLKKRKDQWIFSLQIFLGVIFLYLGVVLFKTKFEATRYYILVLPPLLFALPLYLEAGIRRKAFSLMFALQLVFISENAAVSAFPKQGKAFKQFVFKLDEKKIVPKGAQVLCVSPMSFLQDVNPFDYYRKNRGKGPLCSRAVTLKDYRAFTTDEMDLFDFVIWDGYDYLPPFNGRNYEHLELLYQRDKLLLFRLKKEN